jgi:hypothetical protein
MGASVFRLPRTPRDVLRPFLQVGDSPFDSVRRRSTYRIRMACKRSGVRIPVAPLRDISAGQRHISGLDHALGPPLGIWEAQYRGCFRSVFPQVISCFRVLILTLAPMARGQDHAGVFSQVSGHGFLPGYQAGYRQAAHRPLPPRLPAWRNIRGVARPQASGPLPRLCRNPGTEADASAVAGTG